MDLDFIVKITSVISSVTTPVLLVLAILQLYKMKKDRDSDLAIKVFDWFRDQTFVSYHDGLGNTDTDKIDKIDYYSEDGRKLRKIAIVFEEVGTLIKMKAVQEELILSMISSITVSTWNKMEKFIMQQRYLQNDSKLWEHFEFLKNEAIEFEKTHSDVSL